MNTTGKWHKDRLSDQNLYDSRGPPRSEKRLNIIHSIGTGNFKKYNSNV